MKKLLTILFILTCFFAKAQDTAIDRMGRPAIIKSTGTTLPPDTTNYKVGVFNSTGKLFKMNWPAGGGVTVPGNNSNLIINTWGALGTPASDSLSWDGANGALVNKGVYQGNPATSDVIVKDGAGNIAFRSTNANNWLTPTLAQYYQIGGFNSPVAFTAQGGTTMAQSQFASGKFQITAGTYNLAALPTKNFELVNSADLLKFSIDDSGMVDAKGRLSTDSTLHTLGITQVPVFDTTNYKIDVVDVTGKHSKSYWPSAANIYNSGGSLSSNRTVDLNFNNLNIISGSFSNLLLTFSGLSYLQSGGGQTGFYAGTDSISVKTSSNGSFKIHNLIGQHNASDSMMVYNPSSKSVGMREIPIAVTSLKSVYTPVGNVTTGEDDLISYTIPASTLATDGDYLDFEFSFDFAANTNSKQVKFYFNGTAVYATGAQIQSGGNMMITGKIIRTGATTQYIQVHQNNNCSLFTDETLSAAGTATLSGTVVIKATGEGVATNDIVNALLTIKKAPSN